MWQARLVRRWGERRLGLGCVAAVVTSAIMGMAGRTLRTLSSVMKRRLSMSLRGGCGRWASGHGVHRVRWRR